LIESGFQKNDILTDLNNVVDILHVYENGIEFQQLPSSKDVKTLFIQFLKIKLQKDREVN